MPCFIADALDRSHSEVVTHTNAFNYSIKNFVCISADALVQVQSPNSVCFTADSLNHNKLRIYDIVFISCLIFSPLPIFNLFRVFIYQKIIMVKLCDISKSRDYVAYHSINKFLKISKNINSTQIKSIIFINFVILVGHIISHDNTKFRKFSKSVFGRTLDADLSMKGWLVRVETLGNSRPEGSLEPPSLWVYHVPRNLNKHGFFAN